MFESILKAIKSATSRVIYPQDRFTPVKPMYMDARRREVPEWHSWELIPPDSPHPQTPTKPRVDNFIGETN